MILSPLIVKRMQRCLWGALAGKKNQARAFLWRTMKGEWGQKWLNVYGEESYGFKWVYAVILALCGEKKW